MPESLRKEYAKLRRRPFLTPVWLSVAAAVAVLLAAAWTVVTASTTTVFVMRHAEAAAEPADDPGLSLAGQVRARQLAAFFAVRGELGLDVVLVSRHRRTRETAEPLAAALGVPVRVIEGDHPGEAARRALRDHRGGSVLIVGHSNTVPAIVHELSGAEVPAMPETDHATLYVVSRPHFGRASVTAVQMP